MKTFNPLEWTLRGEDRRFRFSGPINASWRARKNAWATQKILSDTDHRTWQQREADQFGTFYPFIIAARAEASHVTHVAKAQAAMRHLAQKS